MKKLTNEEFISRINTIFNGKYDTSKVCYINAKTKVTLICPEHGEFEATPNHLKDGSGCPHCVNRYITTEQFRKQARLKHGNKYDYSKVNYVNNHTPIIIVCPHHGDFTQSPYSHLSGCGCPNCNGGVRMTQDEFIKRAKEVHNDFYDYSHVEYKNAKTKVKIVCPRHGEFIQTPYCHLKGQGCPKCKSSKMENIVINALNNNNIRFIYQAHIGGLGNKTVDFLLKDYNIVIECQGEQHFIDTYFGSNKSEVSQRVRLDEEKYRHCKRSCLDVLYFTMPTLFHQKIDLNIDFYKDKILYTNIDSLIQDVQSRVKLCVNEKWDNIRNAIFKELPNTIETNHGYQYKNKLLFLFDSKCDNIQKSNWVKYYRNRKIKVMFVDFSRGDKPEKFINWLKDNNC